MKFLLSVTAMAALVATVICHSRSAEAATAESIKPPPRFGGPARPILPGGPYKPIHPMKPTPKPTPIGGKPIDPGFTPGRPKPYVPPAPTGPIRR